MFIVLFLLTLSVATAFFGTEIYGVNTISRIPNTIARRIVLVTALPGCLVFGVVLGLVDFIVDAVRSRDIVATAKEFGKELYEGAIDIPDVIVESWKGI